MKRIEGRLFCLLCLILTTAPLQKLEAQERARIMETDTVTHSLIKQLRETTSEVFHDPAPPRFVMMDKSEKFLFGMGGYVSCNTYYDGTGFLSRELATVLIPTEASPLRSGRFNIDASGARIFFKLIGDTRLGKLQAYIEGGFSAQGNTFSLNHAYVEIRHLLVGQTWSNIMDLKAAPATVDGAGPGGMNGLRQPQFRYGWRFSNGVNCFASLEDPEVTMLSDLLTGVEDVHIMGQRFPDVIVSLGYERARWHLRLAGVLRFLEKQRGYGMAFSGHANLTLHDVLIFQVTGGAGIGHYIQDLGGMGYDVYINSKGLFDKFRVLGYYAAYEHHWSDKCFSGLVYSQTYVMPFEGAPGFVYHHTNYAAINTFREFYEHGQFGIEAIFGNRINLDGSLGYTWRLNCMVRYNF
ncbi:MAG: hypothetical protein KBC07_02850 [Bacteroidales bacterium]|jgi:hypothetical protein|nr:hypothetical protein [Bacteroidales bacterium]NLH24354.1 hypothetical protein [Bacteroidales bacterium]HPJ82282.1 DcaP family trimeric outer membrane transporter [Bacteroidales bacterium]